MGYRYTGLTAGAILALAFFELNGLLRPTVSGPPWQFVVLAALALGAIITWTGLSYRLPVWAVALLNLAAYTLVAFRIASPGTMTFLLPSGTSLRDLGDQLNQAMAIIRNGIEPVIPVSGLVVIVAGVFWLVGAVTAYGWVRSRPAVILVPGLVLVLQFATMDRSPTTLPRIMLFVALLAVAILAVSTDERRATSGRMAHRSGASPRNTATRVTAVAVGVTLLGTVIAVGTLRDSVPYDGVIDWRAATGLTGEFFGSVSYNPFVGIQQSLVTQSDTPLFYARVSGEVPADEIYFRLLTMETYEGGQFFADRPDVEPIEAGRWEAAGHAFAGPTARVTTDVLIDRLQMDWVPAAYAPTQVNGDDAFTGALRVRPDDGSLRLDGGLTYTDLVYSVTSDLPQQDLTVLAGDGQGGLSPLFAAAAASEAGVPTPVETEVRPEPPEVERYLQVPEDLDPGIAALARRQTANLTTPFEIGLALESWLRSSDFRYTTDIEPGHGATDLAEWLLPEYSDRPFFRAGYCENFATSMAVLARTLGVPSRVVLGFTPGEPTVESNVVVVRDRNAHAWTELWIPSQGWIRFDPTPRPDPVNPPTVADVADQLGFDPIAYLEEIPGPGLAFGPDGLNPQQDPGAIPDDVPLDIDPGAFDGAIGVGALRIPSWLQPIVFVLAVLLLVAGALPLVKLWRRRRRMERLRNGDVAAAWEEIVSRLTDLGEEPSDGMTPDELAARVDPVMEPLATVYGRAVYGPPGTVVSSQLQTAERSLDRTTERLAGRYSRGRRIKAWYSPASLVPARFRRH